MEKFAKWADKGTGINPFLPPRSTTSSTAAKAGGLVLSLGLLAVRLPLLCITGSWLFLVSLLTTPWFDILTGSLLLAACYVNHAPNLHTGGSPTPEQTSITLLALGVSLGLLSPLHRLFSLLLLRPALAAVLKTMGVSFIEQHANLRKLGLRPPGHKPLVTRVGATIQPGDLLLSNHTSALDILYFASRSLPLFSCFTLAPEIRFSSLSAFGAVWKAGKVPNKAGQGVTLDKVLAEAKRERRSLVVFPEMVRSNGEGILAFPKGVLDGLAGAGEGGGGAAGGSVGVHLFGFSAVKGDLLATHTVGSSLRFFFRILCRPRTTVHVTYVCARDVPSYPGSRCSSGNKSTSSTPAQWSEEIRGLLAGMLGRPKLGLGYDDFVTFGKYYAAVQIKDDKAAAALASAREKL